MLLRYFYNEKLAQASYLVGCQVTGEAIVIDPGRHIEQYLNVAEAEGVRIIAAAETHIHADFVSGSRELAARVGAKLYLSAAGGPAWQYQFANPERDQLLKDGDIWLIGNIKFEAMHVPGHTPEHLAYLITDTAGANQPMGVFSGDFVFVGDVGRPDLLETAAGVAGAKEVGAQALFASLQRFKTLPDYLQLWPGHGAGSACGKALGAVPSSTVGYERRFNWAWQIEDEATFVEAILADQPEPPRYFATMKQVNKVRPTLLPCKLSPPQLSVPELAAQLESGAPVIDTRLPADFAAAHISGIFNIPAANRSFINYAGWYLDYQTPYYLTINEALLPQALTDLTEIGLDQIAGYCPLAVIDQWSEETNKPLQTISKVAATEISQAVQREELAVVDVRGAAEFAAGHLPNAKNILVGRIPDYLDQIPSHQSVLLYCLSGFRSHLAAGFLTSKGRTNILNLEGGYQAWIRAGLPSVAE